MKPNTQIDKGLVDNAASFTDPFFQRFAPRPAPSPLELREGLSKTYSFPTFYADVTCAIAIFLCDSSRAQAILPHPSMKPVAMPGGRSAVLLSCYQYKNVMNIAPYNEIAMTIPVMVNAGYTPPLLPLVMDFKKKGYYVFSMPVTSLENQIRGTKIWGLPKIVEEIDVSTEGESCTTVARDENGEVYFELSVPKAGSGKHFDETGFLYSMLEGQLLKSQTNFKGDFAVNTNASLLWKKGQRAESPALKLGSSSRADVLKSLQIEEVAFQFRFAESMNSCFDLPLPSAEGATDG
jgi:hypothetical protein